MGVSSKNDENDDALPSSDTEADKKETKDDINE
jgi:hypothetical protein